MGVLLFFILKATPLKCSLPYCLTFCGLYVNTFVFIVTRKIAALWAAFF